MADSTVREILDRVRAAGRTALTAPEGKRICDSYGIPTPREGVAGTAEEAVALAAGIGYPVALKIVSPDILHKTEAGGVRGGPAHERAGADGVATIMANATPYNASPATTRAHVQQFGG